MRAFHPGTGRAVAGVKEKTVTTARYTTSLRAYFAALG
jgi:hypothetical protein